MDDHTRLYHDSPKLLAGKAPAEWVAHAGGQYGAGWRLAVAWEILQCYQTKTSRRARYLDDSC